MSFQPYVGTGPSAIFALADVTLNNPSNSQVLSYDSNIEKWINSTKTISYADLPAGVTITVFKSGGVWPARPTARTDLVVAWRGPDPAPAIVTSGTGGMLENVDKHEVTP